ncbi:MAG: helicase C-terminal domain-containing protein [Promethearchaeota archaeon]
MDYLTFFPYKQYREEQEEIIKQIEVNSKSKKNILLVAPNGTGKTIIALSGLLPLAYEKNLKIIYTCRTHSQNTRIIKELNKISHFLAKNNIRVKLNGLSIRGRKEMCLNRTLLSLKLNPKESMSVCRDLRKNNNCTYFLNLLKKKDRVNNPLLLAPDLFNLPIDAEDLIKFCKDEKICPYFLSKFLLSEMKIIICNYQWIFNPFIQETFLQFIDQELHNCILVLDECHNVIDVATEVNSDKISPYLLRLCLKDLEMYRAPILMQSFVKILLTQLKKKKELLKVEEKPVKPGLYLEQIYKKLGFKDLNELKNFIEELYDFSVSIHEEKIANGEISRDFVGSFAEFWIKWLNTYSLDSYFFCYNVKEKKGKRSVSLEIVALDPREITIPILKQVYTCLNLSGTANPYVYNYLIGLNESGKSYRGIIADSPFKKENIKALITEGVNTKNENRNPPMFRKINEKINEVLYCTPANTGIFCASYKISNGLLSCGLETIVKKNKKKLFIEEPGLSASENAGIIEDFKSMSQPPNNGAVLLGVCGGRNSEGEDYPGDFMNSVVIAGFPYHLPTPRVEAKINYYDKVFKKQGWNFAYLYPAIQRANQASGRPIRKLSDKGSLIFMDSRFKSKYQWISEWIKTELKVVPDRNNAIVKELYPFWNSN